MTWRIAVDKGGTFTDIIANHQELGYRTAKILSTADPVNLIQEVKNLIGPISPSTTAELRIGTTVATNAILEHKGRQGLFVTTKGFADGVKIGTQERPDLFSLQIKSKYLLYAKVIEIDERINSRGEILKKLDQEECTQKLKKLSEKYNTVCISFLNAYRNPQHEAQVATIADQLGFKTIICGHKISNLRRWLNRSETALVEAYVAPLWQEYVAKLQQELGDIPLLVMQSHGGILEAPKVLAKDTILSGPAGGVYAASTCIQQENQHQCISFDMGGTSTDVTLFSGEPKRIQEQKIANIHIQGAMLDIHTVAAGGSSILSCQNKLLRVGPESAGADPGPCCYGLGGPLTLTDCHVLLGTLKPEFFGNIFGKTADLPLQSDLVLEKFKAFANELAWQNPYDLAKAFIQIAVEQISQGIRHISSAQGHNPADFTLISFGGAAGQIVCDLSEQLGIKNVICNPHAGLLSAYGILQAPRQSVASADISTPLENVELNLDLWKKLIHKTTHGKSRYFLELHYENREQRLSIEWQANETKTEVQKKFAAEHKRLFGFQGRGNIYLGEITLSHQVETPKIDAVSTNIASSFPKKNETLSGPRILRDPYQTVHLLASWRAKLSDSGQTILEKEKETITTDDKDEASLYYHRFSGIAKDMGAVLLRTAQAINIKERHDFSCAIFAPSGNLISSAPHVPVHLGAMGASVKAIIPKKPKPGTAYLLNSPYAGGSHLPDFTVVSPVYYNDILIAFVATRAHHTEVGGRCPGSMPAYSSSITEEGVVIDPLLILSAGKLQEEQIIQALTSGPWPSRQAELNLCDIQAQLAANQRGITNLQELASKDYEAMLNAMESLQKKAYQAVCKLIANLPSKADFTHSLDPGLELNLHLEVLPGPKLLLDFSKTPISKQHNFFAPRAVLNAAILYVLRCLISNNLPINEGCLKALEIRTQPGSILEPIYPAAVAAGNVETSQLIVDTLLGALRQSAASQGTMNNLSFGNATIQYYETIGGGYGAGPGFAGGSGVQVHMTNSKITDPELLEAKLPILLRSFGIRTKSGGQGKFPGGDGLVREIEFLQPMTVQIISSHRKTPPFGLEGGTAGKTGRNLIIYQNGQTEELPGIAAIQVSSKDRLLIETPGGGGYGSPV